MTKYNLKAIFEDYEKDDDIFSNESQKVKVIKDAISNRLTEAEKIILLLYAETGSMRQLAKDLDVSHSSVIKAVDEIKLKILEYYYTIKAEQYDIKPDNDTDDNSIPPGPLGRDGLTEKSDMEVVEGE